MERGYMASLFIFLTSFYLYKPIKSYIMYVIVNKTKRKEFRITGNWPGDVIDYMLDNGDDIIVISTYSNTIKVPVGFGTKYKGQWEWKEYDYSPDIFELEGE